MASISPDFLNAAGDAAKGMYLSSPDFGAFGDAYQEFLKKHQENYGEPPLSIYHAHAYDATSIIADAVKQVAIQDGDTLVIGTPGAARRHCRHQGLQGPDRQL